MIIDDPIKSKEEAMSESYRERVWDWWVADMYTRLEPDSQVILIMTRWHEDDLAGRILYEQPEGWHVLRLPGIAETQAARDAWAQNNNQPMGLPDPLGRAAGEALNPERFPIGKLMEQKKVMGEAAFNALVQQNPVPYTGGMFTRKDFIIVPDLPQAKMNWVIGLDLAGSMTGDYSVAVLMGRSEQGLYYVADVKRFRAKIGERDNIVMGICDGWRRDYGVRRVILLEDPGAAGKSQSHYLATWLSDYIVKTRKVTANKSFEAAPLASGVQNALVILLKAKWNRDFIMELCSFPSGRHDDQVDAAAAAYNELSKRLLRNRRKHKVATL